MLKQFIFSDKMEKADADTDSTTSCETYADKEMQMQIVDEESLQQVWNELKSGVYKQAKRIELHFNATDAYRKISKLRRLDDVFVALGNLAYLEELVFTKSELLVSSVCKLLKKSSLKRVKFHHCILIAKKMEATDKLWTGLAAQKQLTCLEVVDCQYTDSETLCRNRTTFTYCLPAFLLHSNSLQRLVLDECKLDSEAFTALLKKVPTLQELELRPVWQVCPTVARRQRYQTKKRVIREFLTETIPDCLAENTTLQKFLISVDDYHLEQVFVETMTFWIDLVQHDNATLKDLRVTHRPLGEASEKPDWYAEEDPEEYAESYLHHNLKAILQLNQMFSTRKQQQQQQQRPKKEVPQVEEEQEDLQPETAKAPLLDEQDITEIWV